MTPDTNKSSSSALVKSEKKALKKHAAKQAPAKPHPKKHAKPHPAKHEKHGPHGKEGKEGKEGKGGKDLRRVYEHLARVRVLLERSGGEARLRTAAERLATLVTEDIRTERAAPKLAAELARAAEHIAFASLVAHEGKTLPWSPRIEEALDAEYRKLDEHAELGKAKKGANERSEAIRTLHALMAETARMARKAKDHARAMESVRAAESLASALEEAE